MRLAIAIAAACLTFPGGLSAAPARATDPPKPTAPTPGPGAEASTGAVTAPRAGGARPMRAGTRTGFPRASDNPEANAGEALLRAAGARLAGRTNLAAEGVVRETAALGEAENVQVVPFAVTLASGGRQFEEYGDSTYPARVVSDGRTQWTWLGTLGQHTRYRGAGPVLDSLAAHHREQQPPGGVSGIVCAPVAGAALGLVSAVRLREDTLHAADRVLRCDVVAATYASPHPGDTALVRRELWIAKDDGLPWRHGFRSEQRIGETGQILHRSQFVTFSRLELDGTPADSLFAFRAPDGSREVLAFEAPGRGGANLTGRPAPPFALRDLAGREHGLDALAGKVVLLDFWASWCGPCRMTMPALDKLTREFAGQGLVVYSVNLREKAETAAAYMKKFGYSMTTLLDPDGSTAQRYGVSAIPVMIVIGRDGQVVAHLTGAHGEATMRAALERAGIQ